MPKTDYSFSQIGGMLSYFDSIFAELLLSYLFYYNNGYYGKSMTIDTYKYLAALLHFKPTSSA